ncbi:unnamed protein product [Arabidopsis thaliana]|uniref:(thale cress) hypothetical protein n=1 Tax=Arabidopsis thaliana TaxID=3702 RepID=A0A7G2EK79_ARATH|nr:unnamed protein product [Arabidopsis thaliana]
MVLSPTSFISCLADVHATESPTEPAASHVTGGDKVACPACRCCEGPKPPPGTCCRCC